MGELDCAVLIPVYNGAATVGDVVRGVLRYTNRVIVVDDGSTDGTAEVLRGFPDITVLTHEVNKRKGAALQTGMRHAREQGIGSVITLDADGQHDPDDIPKFLAAYEEGHGALLIGSRFLLSQRRQSAKRGARSRPREMPRVRYLSNTISSALISIFIGQRLSDIQCGYRLYETDLLERIPLEETGFNFETEIVAKAVRLGIKVGEVPIRCLYPEGVVQSHYRPLRDSWQIARTVLWARSVARRQPRPGTTSPPKGPP
jgi:glycosyltransferase involved in cell wall biosynthesis